jgi:hypothetical protein
MVQPGYVPQQPMQYAYPQQQQQQQQQQGRPQPPPWPPRTNPPPQTAQQQQQQATPPITARGMMPDTAKVVSPAVKLTAVSMPSPDEVGVVPPGAKSIAMPSPTELGVSPPGKVDWNETHSRLDRLGAFGLQMVQLNDGRHRVAFVLRTAKADQVQHVEVTAATAAEAVTLALERAETVSSGQ